MADKMTTKEMADAVKTPHRFQAFYLGSMPMDRLYSQTMQPWVMAEVRRKRQGIKDVTLEVSGDIFRVINAKQEENAILLEHNVKGITRFAKLHQDPLCFAYLTRYQLNADFECHVFLAKSEELVST